MTPCECRYGDPTCHDPGHVAPDSFNRTAPIYEGEAGDPRNVDPASLRVLYHTSDGRECVQRDGSAWTIRLNPANRGAVGLTCDRHDPLSLMLEWSRSGDVR